MMDRVSLGKKILVDTTAIEEEEDTTTVSIIFDEAWLQPVEGTCILGSTP